MRPIAVLEPPRLQTNNPFFVIFGGFLFSLFLILSFFSFVLTAQAALPPAVVTYQGKLLVNNLAATTTQSVIFVLYDAATAGNALYTAGGTVGSPTAISVTPTNGLFAVDFGSTGTNELDPAIFQGTQSIYLEVRVGSETLSPRKQITASPFAYNAKYLDGVGATSTASSSTYIPVSDSVGNFNLRNVTSTALNVSGLSGLTGGFISNASSSFTSLNGTSVTSTIRLATPEIHSIGKTNQSLILQNQTFTPSVSIHNAVSINPIYNADNGVNTGLSINALQQGNGSSLYGLGIIASKSGAATSLSSLVAMSAKLEIPSGTVTNGINSYLGGPIINGAITNMYGLYIENVSVGGTKSQAIHITDQANLAATTRVMMIEGRGSHNSIEWGDSALQYANSAENIRFINSTNNQGIDFDFATANSPRIIASSTNARLALGTGSPQGMLTLVNGGLFIGNGTTSSSLENNLFMFASSTTNAQGLLFIDSSGNVSVSGTFRAFGGVTSTGLGIVSAVGANNTATTTITFYSTSTNPGNALVFDTNRSIASSTAALYSWRNNAFKLMSLSASGTLDVFGAISAMTATLGTPGAPGDLAERVDIAEEEIVAPGDVMTIDHDKTDTYRRFNSAQDNVIAGVISTNPTIVVGNGKTATTAVLAMLGRVPVKITLENGPINIGDPLTVSQVIGRAAKATTAGMVLGYALESITEITEQNQGRVLMFLRPTWWSPFDLAQSSIPSLVEGWSPGLALRSAAGAVNAETNSDPSAISQIFANLVNAFREWGVVIERGLIRIKKLVVDDELCINNTCLTEQQLQKLLEHNQTSFTPPTESVISTPIPINVIPAPAENTTPAIPSSTIASTTSQ